MATVTLRVPLGGLEYFILLAAPLSFAVMPICAYLGYRGVTLADQTDLRAGVPSRMAIVSSGIGLLLATWWVVQLRSSSWS